MRPTLQANAAYDPAHCLAFQCDLTQDDLTASIPPACCDMVTAFFVLSALGPSEWDAALANVAKVIEDVHEEGSVGWKGGYVSGGRVAA